MIRAYVVVMSYWGNYYAKEYQAGSRDVIPALEAEEQNLLCAWRLARDNQWWDRMMGAIRGLRALYDHTGRGAEWASLVHGTVPSFVDPDTDLPLPGREEQWSTITGYRANLAEGQRDSVEAERLQRLRVDWNRDRAAAALALETDELIDARRDPIQALAVSLQGLGIILRERSDPGCVTTLKEGHNLLLRIGDRPAAAALALNLGHAYLDVPDVRDLDEAERWYKHSLNLRSENDPIGRGQSLGQLGRVALDRFDEAHEDEHPGPELTLLLRRAACYYDRALDLFPADAIRNLSVTHDQLGGVHRRARDVSRALRHYREAIRHKEQMGDRHDAAKTRFNAAGTLAEAGRFPEALAWANAALRDYQTYGELAAAEIQMTRRLIAQIQRDLAAQQSSPDDTTNASP